MPLPPSRYPRALVSFDGQTARWDDVVEIVWEPNVYYEADTLTVTLQNVGPSGELLSDYLRKEMTVDLWLGYVADPNNWSAADLPHVFFGQIDGVLPKFGSERLVDVRCRDLSRLLIDTEETLSLVNMLASDVAVLFAQQVNLAAEVVPTPLVADLTTFEKKSQWEILQVLAEREGYIVFVDTQGVLHFQPRAAASPSIGQWVYNGPPYDILAADFDDSSLLVNTVTVLVWLGVDQGLASGQAIDDARVAAMGGRTVERIVYSRTAKDANECAIEAQGILTSLARAPITGTATLEGNPALVGDVVVTLTGQLGRFANDYYVERATHHLSAQNAYTVDVTVTNVRPEASEVYRDALYQGPTDAATQAASQGATAATSGLPSGATAGSAPRPGPGPWNSGSVGPHGQVPVGDLAFSIAFGFKQPYSHPFNAAIPLHRGVDLILPGANNGEGTTYGAMQAGTVAALTWDPNGGNGIIIQMANGLYTRYFHNDKILVSQNQKVTQGQPIGVLGQTGTVGFPHLHFEVSAGINGDPQGALIDPVPWIPITQPQAASTSGGTVSPPVSPTVTTVVSQAGVTTTTTVPKPPPAGLFPSDVPDFVIAAIQQSGWPQSVWATAAAVSKLESSGWDPKARYTVPGQEDSVGLWQINLLAHSQYTATQLMDPNTNARAAYQIWLAAGGTFCADWICSSIDLQLCPRSSFTAAELAECQPGTPR